MSRASSSYVHLSKKFESPDNIFVAVPEIGTRYSLRFGATIATLTNPEIFVDRNHDFLYYCLVAPVQTESDGFWNATRDKKAYFKFSKTLWTNDEIDTNNLPRKGGIGAITLFFYLARRTKIKNAAPFKFTLEKVSITESKEIKESNFLSNLKKDQNHHLHILKSPGIYPNIFIENVDFKDFRPLPSIKKDDAVSDVRLEDDAVFVKNSNSESSSSSLVKYSIKKEEIQKRKDSHVIIDLTGNYHHFDIDE
ncbi:5705_t:CDS:2 [Ambispora leptoticha]|uniref:5705_t:CDS:1 n=1 Tax=Ambispora leptoticha TaxID=144679 RepID=A0A9N9B7V8_9GLOM|nr:5705_t:CDS:2 [Ambispora leptoticha]